MNEEFHGKILLDAQTFLMPKRRKIDASVYIHLKGYTRARVSHLDVEKIGLDKVIRRGRGNFLEVRGIEKGLEIVMRESRMVEIDGGRSIVSSLMIASPFLNEVVGKNKSTRAWVGRKYDGIYIGFRKEEIQKLERVALEKFGVKPLEMLEKPPLTVGKRER